MRWPLLPAVLMLSLPAGAQIKQVIVVPAQGSAPDGDQRAVLAQLRAAIGGVDGFELVGVERTLSELDAAKEMGLACRAEDEGCLARLALVMPSDRLVVPVLDATEAGALKLRLDVYDAATAGLLQRVERELPPTGPGRVPVIQEAAAVLLAPERHVGALVVKVVAPFTSASLDGGEQLPGPEVRFDSVAAGTHIVTAFDGDRTTSQNVVVAPGDVTRLALGGASSPPIGANREAEDGAAWWPLAAGLGVAATGGVVAAGAGTVSAFLLADLFGAGLLLGQAQYPERQLALGMAFASGGVALLGVVCMAGGAALAAAGPLL